MFFLWLVMKLFPMLQTSKTPTKPQTQKRFDSVFTAIKLLMNLAGWSFITTLHSLLSLLHNRITSVSFFSPHETALGLKACRAYYLAFIRGGKAFADISFPNFNAVTIESYSGYGSKETRILERIMSFRTEVIEGGLTPKDILMFDRLVFAILSFDRIMTYSNDPDFTSITASSNFKYDPKTGYFDNLPILLSRLGITKSVFWAEVRAQAKRQRHEIMATGGVNGPASWTAHTDAKAILGNTALYNTFSQLAKKMGMQWLLQDLVSCVSLPSHDAVSDHTIHSGRLHHFDEWGGKTRVVAIVDYWSQILLSPIHNAIFTFLSRIESDGTFNQDAACERVAGFTAQSGAEVYSYDLTAATDRLPISIQEEILAYLTSPSFARLWAELLVGRSYYHKDTNKHYTYAVGQPMGSKSSWAMLALTHHVIVQKAAVSVSSESYMDYALLGDDITLTRSAIAQAYLSIMSSLDVAINMAKSVVHSADVLSAAEFCKRIYVNGMELTTFPVKLIAKTIMNGRIAPQLQNEVARRGFNITDNYVLSWLVGLVDPESARFLAILNVIPSSLSSILYPIKPGNKLGTLSNWFGEKHVLKEDDVKQAYIYVAVTEQLKRLDNLLRQAQIIHSAIETNAFGYSTFDPARLLGWSYSDPAVDLKQLAATMPQLSPSHPIVKGAQAEMDRLAALLADLRSGDTRVTEKARAHLLDMFRSSLVDNWMDTDAARGQADRSLVQRALTLLSDIILNRAEPRENRAAHSVDFTVNLAYLNRLWTVTWTLGQQVEINSVRSRVLSTSTEANLRLNEIDSVTSIPELFHIAPVVKKGRKVANVSQSPVARAVQAEVTKESPS